MSDFEVKDTGSKEEYDGGMVRNSNEGKRKPHLVRSGPMYNRWVDHLTAGAKVYSDNNWMQAEGQAEYDRFRESAARHFDQWWDGERDEDHAAAVFFNLNGAEYVREKMEAEAPMTVREAWQVAQDAQREATAAGTEDHEGVHPWDLFADQEIDNTTGLLVGDLPVHPRVHRDLLGQTVAHYIDHMFFNWIGRDPDVEDMDEVVGDEPPMCFDSDKGWMERQR
jgi:hypothetical protein